MPDNAASPNILTQHLLIRGHVQGMSYRWSMVQAAQQRGIPTINGGEIVALQAAQQFELYTGVRPSDELIEAAERYSQQG